MTKYLIVLFLAVTGLCTAQSVTKTMLRLPDTGETTSYTTSFGEDNDFTINAPFFIDNGNSTVTDTVTGLMWQQTDGGEMTVEEASVYCDTLTLGGYTDWRLPNAHESFSILNQQHANPALDVTIFTTTGAEYWWTSIRQANDSNRVWVTNAGGGIGNHPKSETISAGGTKKFHTRAVRDVTVPLVIPVRFGNNYDGTITDNFTNLIWQQTPYPDTLTWEQTLNYADTLSLASNTDWRLPNIKELQSINDESLINPSISPNVFPTIHTTKYWSSTTLPNQTTKAWYLDTQFGITTYDVKTAKHNLICVRGNENVTTAINEITKAEPISFYPNPFNETIHIKSQIGNEQYELRNSIGQLIYSGTDIESENFSDLNAGIYFLKVTNKKTSLIKLIKE